MRICYIVEAMSAGVGRHVVDLACGMADRDHVVHVLYSRKRADAALIEELERHPAVATREVGMERGPHPSDLLALFRVGRYILKHGPFDVVHGHSSKGGFLSRLAALITTSGSVYTPHAFVTMSPELSAPAERVYRLVERFLGMISSKVICTSRHERSHAIGLGVGARKAVVIPNALNPTGFSPVVSLRENLGLSPDRIIVGFAGRLEFQKGADVLLKAARLALNSMPVLHFVIIGDGGEMGRLRAMAADLRLDGHCSWLGAQPARRYLKAFDILAIPSRYEGMPYILLEALSCGTPVVCTDFGGCTEIVRDRQNGLVVPLEDSAAMASRFIELATDDGLRRRLSGNARGLMAPRTVDRMCAESEALYFGWPPHQARVKQVETQETSGERGIIPPAESADATVATG